MNKERPDKCPRYITTLVGDPYDFFFRRSMRLAFVKFQQIRRKVMLLSIPYTSGAPPGAPPRTFSRFSIFDDSQQIARGSLAYIPATREKQEPISFRSFYEDLPESLLMMMMMIYSRRGDWISSRLNYLVWKIITILNRHFAQTDALLAALSRLVAALRTAVRSI